MSLPIVRAFTESAKYQKNILPKSAEFNNAYSWGVVVTGGSGTATVVNDDMFVYQGERAMLITATDCDFTIGVGDNRLTTIINRDGNYILAMRVFVPTTYNSETLLFTIYLYKNSVLYNEFLVNINTDNLTFGEWNTFYQQVQGLEVDDEISMDFKVGYEGGTYVRFALDGFEMKLNDRALEGASRYVGYEPKVYEVTQNLTLSEIAGNGVEQVNITLTGAQVGDYVEMTYPVGLLSQGLVVGYPIVSATNTVSFLMHNHSGAGVTPIAGNYTVKIVK